jgi:hypothetical protein
MFSSCIQSSCEDITVWELLQKYNLLLVGWHAAEYIIGSAFAARKELAEVIFLPTGLTGG